MVGLNIIFETLERKRAEKAAHDLQLRNFVYLMPKTTNHISLLVYYLNNKGGRVEHLELLCTSKRQREKKRRNRTYTSIVLNF
jgi:hypothetical protein